MSVHGVHLCVRLALCVRGCERETGSLLGGACVGVFREGPL